MTIQPTLLFSTLFAVSSASIYGYVGWRLSKRVISSSDARLAWGSFTLWWYGLAGGLAEQDWWQLASRFIGLAAALTILLAYLPPRWLKQRYDILSLSDENPQG